VMERLEPRNLVGVLEELLTDSPEDPAAFAGGQSGPRAVERRARRDHGGVDVAPAGRRYRRDDLLGRRVDDVERLTAGGVAPGAVDEELLLHQRRGSHGSSTNKLRNRENTTLTTRQIPRKTGFRFSTFAVMPSRAS